MQLSFEDQVRLDFERQVRLKPPEYNLLIGSFIVSIEKFHIDEMEEQSIEFTFKIASGEFKGIRIFHSYRLVDEKEKEEAFNILTLCGFDPKRGIFLNNENDQKMLKGFRLELFLADRDFKVCKRLK